MDGTEKTYEMMWDCEYCGSDKLLGVTHRYCPECGAAQNPDKRYFPPDDQKVAVQDHKYVGADLKCPACEEAMSAALDDEYDASGNPGGVVNLAKVEGSFGDEMDAGDDAMAAELPSPAND